MKLDVAVLELLGLDAIKTQVSSAGGGGCSSASTYEITSELDNGSKAVYFMKTGTGNEAEVMFRGENASLTAIHNVVPSLCPRSLGHGKFQSQPSISFLVTEFLDLRSRSTEKSKTAESLAAKLAKLHTTPAPTPEGYDNPIFGFPVTTCCGDTPQDNSYKPTWAEFYANNRLRFISRQAKKRHGEEGELHRLIEVTASQVVPRLLNNDHVNSGRGIIPVVVHGDLWRGNASLGIIRSRGREPEDVIFDSSACYAHNEFELGIMKMFGGFGVSFLKEYHKLCPKTEPVDEYDDRVKLYELYHHLNHYAMFGGSYKSGAMSIMRDLIREYGSGST